MNQPVIARKSPIGIQVEQGKTYYWCACGLSKGQPLCDGSHKDSGITPLAYTAEETGEVWLCCCKQTKTPPMCDGSHSKL